MKIHDVHPPIYGLIAAAGTGSRMKQDRNKQFLELGGIAVVIRTAMAFERHALIRGYRIVCAKDDCEAMRAMTEQVVLPKLLGLTIGGETRQHSVLQGLRALQDTCSQSPDAIVLVHDGARCLVEHEVISRCANSIIRYNMACAAAVPVKDTIKSADPQELLVDATLDRTRLWQVQTPQGARLRDLLQAYEDVTQKGILVTDDLSVMESAGYQTRLSIGNYRNIKLTTPEDLAVGEALIRLSGEQS